MTLWCQDLLLLSSTFSLLPVLHQSWQQQVSLHSFKTDFHQNKGITCGVFHSPTSKSFLWTIFSFPIYYSEITAHLRSSVRLRTPSHYHRLYLLQGQPNWWGVGQRVGMWWVVFGGCISAARLNSFTGSPFSSSESQPVNERKASVAFNTTIFISLETSRPVVDSLAGLLRRALTPVLKERSWKGVKASIIPLSLWTC